MTVVPEVSGILKSINQFVPSLLKQASLHDLIVISLDFLLKELRCDKVHRCDIFILSVFKERFDSEFPLEVRVLAVLKEGIFLDVSEFFKLALLIHYMS